MPLSSLRSVQPTGTAALLALCLGLGACEDRIADPLAERDLESMPAPVPVVADPDAGIAPLTGFLPLAAPPGPPAAPPGHVTLLNFAADGTKLLRFHEGGNGLDAHDGEIERFGDLYYLYGVSYGCGFEWRVDGSPFCGIKVYSSPDLVQWSYQGLLFDHLPEKWQRRCGGAMFGCFRPHIAYNPATRRYVLWLNSYDVGVGYRVFDSASPTGPFVERPVPHLAVSSPRVDTYNSQYSGDHNLFVDDDGVGYLVYTDWRARGDIVIERLRADYLAGSGQFTRLGLSYVEAPSMFKREGRYYITLSDPACPYCRTGTSYVTARSPLGPWTAPRKISQNSCGGQPTHVSPLPASDGGTVYLYQSDLWNDHLRNQATAAHFWTPLEFTATGEIREIGCESYVNAPIRTFGGATGAAPTEDRFRVDCDLGPRTPYGQLSREVRFTAPRSGRLRELAFPLFRRGEPDGPLEVELRRGETVLRRDSIRPDTLAWSARRHRLASDVALSAGERYAIRFTASTTRGCYGLAYHSDPAPRSDPEQWVTIDSGRGWFREEDRTMKLNLRIEAD